MRKPSPSSFFKPLLRGLLESDFNKAGSLCFKIHVLGYMTSHVDNLV